MKPHLTYYSGAVLVAKKKFDTLDPKIQKLLLKEIPKAAARLSRDVVKQDKISWGVLKRRGLKVVTGSKKMNVKFQATARKAEKQMVKMGIYSSKWLKKVRKLRDES